MARPQQTETLDLAHAAQLLLNECRMVLPGIQALFGFQLIVVFSQRFAQVDVHLQHLHLAATALVVIAIALIMTPAAYHRHAGAREVTDLFVTASTRLLVASMGPLAIGLCLEFYIVESVLWPSGPVGVIASAMFAMFVLLWFGLPRLLVARGKAGARNG